VAGCVVLLPAHRSSHGRGWLAHMPYEVDEKANEQKKWIGVCASRTRVAQPPLQLLWVW
jgi:DNA-binding IclR family transcriptional regulator